jgi:hypothetical protein
LTDWIHSPTPVPSVRFSADNRWLLIQDEPALELHLAEGPIPAWLPELAEAVAGFCLTARQDKAVVPENALARLRNELASSPATDRLTVWAREFIADEAETTNAGR